MVHLIGDLYFFLFDFETRKKNVRIDRLVDHFFTLIELCIFSDFFRKLIKSAFRGKIIKILTGLFVLFFILTIIKEPLIFRDISYRTLNITYTIEAIILLIFCLLYYFELFKSPPVLVLLNEPSFWVSTGLFFFLSCTLPYSLLENYLVKNYFDLEIEFYALFYIFYSLLSVMLIRAYLCKPVKTI